MERASHALLGLRDKPRRLRARLPAAGLLHHPLAANHVRWSRDKKPRYCISSSYDAVSIINGSVLRSGRVEFALLRQTSDPGLTRRQKQQQQLHHFKANVALRGLLAG